MTQQQIRRSYSNKLKRNAVALSEHHGRQMNEVAENSGSPSRFSRVALREAIGKRYRFHGGTAGSPLIAADLRGEEGWSHVSRTRVAREMKALGLRCRVRPARKVFTTQSRHGQLVASNQLERCFKVKAPNLVWVSDTTYLAVGPKWHYLSVFLDLFSRKVVGWDLHDSFEAEGVLTAFRQAIRTRSLPPG